MSHIPLTILHYPEILVVETSPLEIQVDEVELKNFEEPILEKEADFQSFAIIQEDKIVYSPISVFVSSVLQTSSSSFFNQERMM